MENTSDPLEIPLDCAILQPKSCCNLVVAGVIDKKNLSGREEALLAGLSGPAARSGPESAGQIPGKVRHSSFSPKRYRQL